MFGLLITRGAVGGTALLQHVPAVHVFVVKSNKSNLSQVMLLQTHGTDDAEVQQHRGLNV